MPQVLGAVRATLENAAASLRIEMNAATDNPLIFPEGTSVSGGDPPRPAVGKVPHKLALGAAAPAGSSARRTSPPWATPPRAPPPLCTPQTAPDSRTIGVANPP